MYADESGLEEGEKEIIDEILEDLELNFCTCVDVLDNQYLKLYPPSYMPSNMGGGFIALMFSYNLRETRRQARTRRQALIH